MAKSDIDKQIEVVDGTMTQEQAQKPDYERVFQVYPNTRVPVSKATGSFWHNRQKECKARLTHSRTKDRWDEAIKYYQNDQGGRMGKRKNLTNISTNSEHEDQYATENIVFANVSALLPAVYAKNPDIEITAVVSANEAKAKMYERLVDTLFQKKVSPGVNMKPKARRATITSMLTNVSYFEVSYIRKEESSEQVLQEIETLSKELEEGKNSGQLEETEGKLQALLEKVSLLDEPGPRVRVVQPHMVLVDPNSEEEDLSDANYIIIGDFLRTSYIRAVYATKDEETGQYKSIYQPTHVIPAESKDIAGHDSEINNFTLLQDNSEHTMYGYENEAEFNDAARTLVWYVWDKTTRRVLMFNDKDWSWPIWVWDDPYKLSRFFPIFPLQFYVDPIDRFARSEIMYYLDQQDEINVINRERARMRAWVMSKVFYDKESVKDSETLQKFLTNHNDFDTYGISLPEGKKVTDVVGTMPLPSMQFEQIFDVKPQLEAINRLSSVTPILQNTQFKTNTTNKAIESYESSTQTRLDEKIDAIEAVLGDIGEALIELCIQFMPVEVVEELIGSDIVNNAGGWDMTLTPNMFHKSYTFNIVGGSTLKPTSRTKKEQAAQLGQILGQFVQASPAVVIVLLKVLERAFSEDFVITPEDWRMIIEGTIAQIQGASAAPKGESQPNQEKPEATQKREAEQGGNEEQLVQAAQQVEQLIDQLPPELRVKIGKALAQGVPLRQIASAAIREAQQTTQRQPTRN